MTETHIRDTGVEKKSVRLSEKRIGFAICGGIAAVESVKLIRELRRHGAEVFPYFTPDAERFVGKLSVAWASSRDVVMDVGYDVDHLAPFDLVIVAPATLNSVSKSAYAITDNAVLLLIASQIGRKGKVLFVPTMNEVLKMHPGYAEAKKRLIHWGAEFFENEFEESRMKMPSPENLAKRVFEMIGSL